MRSKINAGVVYTSGALILKTLLDHKEKMTELKEEKRREVFKEAQILANNKKNEVAADRVEKLEARTRDLEEQIGSLKASSSSSS